jgi:predicted O-linked N-acetylglucosamine transferase (SPINDLY family)
LILANTLIDRKRLEAAREACEKAQALDPVSPLPWLAAVALLRGESQFLAAETAARKAIQLDETLAAGWIALGDALTRLDQPREADKAFQRAYALDPEADWLRGMAIHNQMNACDWNKYAQTLPSLLRAVGLGKKSCTPFVMLSLEDSPALQHQAADTYVRARYPDHSEAGALPAGTAHDKLRLGYYSADFRNHAVSFLMAEIFELHDRDRFQVIGFDFGVGVPDEMRQRVSQAFDRFIHVHDQSDYEVAALSRDLGIDIAIDLGGHTQGSRTGIYADRAAPIQVNYLGYPGTMAAPFIDYILADSVLITPDTQPHYSEKVVYLPHFQANDSKRRISERIFTRAEVGLPKTGFAYCCFNATYKINPETFASWMRILKQVENAVLWLFEANQEAVHHLRHAAREHGIAPERLVFANKLPVPEYLARYRLADLFLDTLPYNAGTTASDALWAGLPVLTLAGQSFVSRMAASLLHAVGLPELITHSRGEYEALAIALANDSARLAEIRVRLAENRMTAPLFDAPRFTRHLEAAYRAMHERQQAGLPPDHILIEPIP